MIKHGLRFGTYSFRQPSQLKCKRTLSRRRERGATKGATRMRAHLQEPLKNVDRIDKQPRRNQERECVKLVGTPCTLRDEVVAEGVLSREGVS